MHHHQAQSQTIWILLMINCLWSGSTVFESAAGVPLIRPSGSETQNLRKDEAKISFAATVSEENNDISFYRYEGGGKDLVTLAK